MKETVEDAGKECLYLK